MKSIQALSEELGIEPRQIRYMIAEGMMPPAGERGRDAAGYGPDHVDAGRRYLRLQAMGFRGEGLKALMLSEARVPLPVLTLHAISVTVDPEVDPSTIDVDDTLSRIGEALRLYVNPKGKE